jgi:hypothetical protein
VPGSRPSEIDLPSNFTLFIVPYFLFLFSNTLLHLSGSTSIMTYQLPPMLLNLFAPRPPLRWVEPTDHAPETRQTPKISGVGQYLQAMREYKDNDGYVPSDSWLQTRDRKKMEKQAKQENLVNQALEECTALPPTPGVTSIDN